jgi:t-SNARE complex subunit (syntaxin)
LPVLNQTENLKEKYAEIVGLFFSGALNRWQHSLQKYPNNIKDVNQLHLQLVQERD